MAAVKGSNLFWRITLTFAVVCLLVQLSNAMPRSRMSRQRITYLRKRVPPSLVPLLPHTLEEKLPFLTEITERAFQTSDGAKDAADVGKIGEGEDEEDYDYVDHDVYQFTHYWDSMAQFVYDLVNEVNLTQSDQLVQVSDKVVELETRLAARDEEIAFLREAVGNLTEKTKEPEVGDLRLIDHENGENETTGRLLFYAGENMRWGYVCDDMFSTVAATVVCRQLGFSGGLVHAKHDTASLFGPQHQKYSIVLDDVMCEPDNTSLLTCRHLPIGVHNCGPSEAVNVRCLS